MSNYSQIHLTEPAAADLRDIKSYSIKLLGKTQTVKYLNSLNAKCLDLLMFLYSGIERLDIDLVNTRSITVKEHTIFYRLEKESISILRIMHQHTELTQLILHRK